MNPERQQFQSYLNPSYRSEEINQDQTYRGNQPYVTQNIVYNTREHGQAPTQKNLENPIAPQQQSKNIQAPWLSYASNLETLTSVTTSYTKSTGIL